MIKRLPYIIIFLWTQMAFAQKSVVDVQWGNGVHSLCFSPASQLVDEGKEYCLGEAGKMWGTSIGGVYNRYIQSGLGFQTGVRFYLFRTKTVLDSLEQSLVYDVANKMEFVHSVHCHNWQELQTNGMLAVPVGLAFTKPIGEKVHFAANGGVELLLPLFSKYKVEEGCLSVTGYYKEYDVEFSDMPIHNFTSYSDKPSGKFDLKVGVAVYADAGIRYNLGGITLNSALYFSYGLIDMHNASSHSLLNVQNNYVGLLDTDSSGSVHPLAFGVKVGLSLPKKP